MYLFLATTACLADLSTGKLCISSHLIPDYCMCKRSTFVLRHVSEICPAALYTSSEYLVSSTALSCVCVLVWLIRCCHLQKLFRDLSAWWLMDKDSWKQRKLLYTRFLQRLHVHHYIIMVNCYTLYVKKQASANVSICFTFHQLDAVYSPGQAICCRLFDQLFPPCIFTGFNRIPNMRRTISTQSCRSFR